MGRCFVEYLSPLKHPAASRPSAAEKSAAWRARRQRGASLMKVVFAGAPEFVRHHALRADASRFSPSPLVLTQPTDRARMQCRPQRQIRAGARACRWRNRCRAVPTWDPGRAEGGTHATAQCCGLRRDGGGGPYGLILPRSTLDIRPCINIHDNNAAGDAARSSIGSGWALDAGVTIMKRKRGLDTGPMLIDGGLANRRRTPPTRCTRWRRWARMIVRTRYKMAADQPGLSHRSQMSA
jgi:hypothetical protein